MKDLNNDGERSPEKISLQDINHWKKVALPDAICLNDNILERLQSKLNSKQ